MNYKGDEVGYHGIHKWLAKTYGRPTLCENIECNGFSITYHWALKRGYEYQRKRKNFLMLCASCHKKYDITDQVRRNLSLAKKGKPSNRKGTTISEEGRLNISEGSKKAWTSDRRVAQALRMKNNQIARK